MMCQPFGVMGTLVAGHRQYGELDSLIAHSPAAARAEILRALVHTPNTTAQPIGTVGKRVTDYRLPIVSQS
eukprot:5905660-Prymnesium_polylepis.1